MTKSVRLFIAGRSALLLSLVGAFLWTGCVSVGPDYSPPAPTSPSAWHTTLDNGLAPASTYCANLARWWETLDDPTLTDLVASALACSPDIRQALAKIREARASRGAAKAELFPTVDLGGSGTTNRISKSSSSTPLGLEQELYKAGFDATWEIDVFGGVRRSVEAAQANLEGAWADLDDVRVTLAAETAQNYLEVRTYQYRLDVALENIKSQEETYALIKSRFEAGLSNELDTQQARYNLESTRSQLPTLRTSLEAAKNRLAVLTGQTPGSLHPLLQERRPIPVPPISIAVGVPAETLRRRPDIRSAERQLAAQTARIGVATADLYPKFQLLGSIGLETIRFGEFLEQASRYWSLGPSITWRIFNAGAIRRNIEVQTAIQEQYLAAYEKAVLGALEEVENALTAYGEEQLRRAHLREAVDAAQKAADKAQDRYTSGLDDFSTVLEAQRSLFSFQDELAQSEGTVTTNLIVLYKALGGGWEPMTETTKASSKRGLNVPPK